MHLYRRRVEHEVAETEHSMTAGTYDRALGQNEQNSGMSHSRDVQLCT